MEEESDGFFLTATPFASALLHDSIPETHTPDGPTWGAGRLDGDLCGDLGVIEYGQSISALSIHEPSALGYTPPAEFAAAYRSSVLDSNSIRSLAS